METAHKEKKFQEKEKQAKLRLEQQQNAMFGMDFIDEGMIDVSHIIKHETFW